MPTLHFNNQIFTNYKSCVLRVIYVLRVNYELRIINSKLSIAIFAFRFLNTIIFYLEKTCQKFQNEG